LTVSQNWKSLEAVIPLSQNLRSQSIKKASSWVKELAERYETPLPVQISEVKQLEKKVSNHLKIMGFKMESI